jgi:hypothetical protein
MEGDIVALCLSLITGSAAPRLRVGLAWTSTGLYAFAEPVVMMDRMIRGRNGFGE